MKLFLVGSSLKGNTVTILAPEGNEEFVLDAEAEAALLTAMAEADRGQMISADRLLADL